PGATRAGRTRPRSAAHTRYAPPLRWPGCLPATPGATPTPGSTAGTGTGGTTGPGGGGPTGPGTSNPRRLPVTGAPDWTGLALVVGAALILAGAFFNLIADPLIRRIAAVRGASRRT